VAALGESLEVRSNTMQRATNTAIIDTSTVTGIEASETEMEAKPQNTGSSLVTVGVSIIALLLSFVGGLLTSVSSNSEWKGKMEERMNNFEKQRIEDKAVWEHIRNQNEVNGRDLTEIKAMLSPQNRRH
jgi:hypothetical protein